MMEPAAALAHWAKWAVDNGSWRQCCYSAEGNYAKAKERYEWAEDTEKHFRFRYDERTGQKVEQIVNTLPAGEREVLRARHVHWPHLADDIVARRLAMSARAFDTMLLSATIRFGRVWRASHKEAA
jgi:hypothetical protein